MKIIDFIKMNPSTSFNIEKIRQKFKHNYDSLREIIKIKISHIDYNIDPELTFWHWDLKKEEMTTMQRYLYDYYYLDEHKDFLEEFFGNPNITIHYNRQLNHDLWGEEVIYSFFDMEFNEEIFCYMVVYDDMSPNAINQEDECERCRIQIDITYGQKLEDVKTLALT